jgi:hypothetical protein
VAVETAVKVAVEKVVEEAVEMAVEMAVRFQSGRFAISGRFQLTSHHFESHPKVDSNSIEG